jgi:hypothetical protein
MEAIAEEIDPKISSESLSERLLSKARSYKESLYSQ